MGTARAGAPPRATSAAAGTARLAGRHSRRPRRAAPRQARRPPVHRPRRWLRPLTRTAARRRSRSGVGPPARQRVLDGHGCCNAALRSCGPRPTSARRDRLSLATRLPHETCTPHARRAPRHRPAADLGDRRERAAGPARRDAGRLAARAALCRAWPARRSERAAAASGPAAAQPPASRSSAFPSPLGTQEAETGPSRLLGPSALRQLLRPVLR